jgi:predicted permease
MGWIWKRGQRRAEELDEEVRGHLEMAARERVERGMAADEAARGARREFGNLGLVKETTRDVWGWRWLRDLYEDARFGWRTLGKSLGFSLTAILTLALGIGANTAIFSVIDAALLRSLPVRDADRLVVPIWQAQKEPKHSNITSYGDCNEVRSEKRPGGCSFSGPFLQEVRGLSGIFSSVAAFAGGDRLDLSGMGTADTVEQTEYVSGNYFETLGVLPAKGRLIGSDDDTASATPAVVLSYSYWRSKFGGDASAVGKSILLNKVACTIVGVAEERFDWLSPGNPIQMWIPLAVLPRLEVPWNNREVDPANWWLVMAGRLKPGVTRDQAQAAVATIFANETTSGAKPMFKPEDKDGAVVLLTGLEESLTGNRPDVSAPLYVLVLAVGIVLLIACANVAGLLLSRATARQKEMAVRFALGASRGRVVRQLLTESVMLAVAGGALGVLFAWWCLHSITTFAATFAADIDARVLFFTGMVSVLTGVIFGLAPALRGMRVDLTPALKAGMRGGAQAGGKGKSGWSAGNALVVAQVALSIVVLAGAGLLVRTLQNLKNIDPGFDTRNVLTFRLDATLIGYQSAQSDAFFRELRDRLKAMPGVMSATYSWRALLGGGLWTTGFHLAGKPKDEISDADVLPVGQEFFGTMRIALVDGREFNAADLARAQGIEAVMAAERAEAAARLKSGSKPGAIAGKSAGKPPYPAIVNRAFVRKYFATTNPLGQRFGTPEGEPEFDGPVSPGWEIVGVVADARYNNLRRSVEPTIYIPNTGGAVSFAVRTAGDPHQFVQPVRALVNQMDSNLPVFAVKTESQQIDQQVFKERLIARLSGFFGALALLLACIGLYGLISYEVSRRTREIGIRAALGAERRDVLRMVLGQGMRLAFAGAVLGTVLALGLLRYAKSLLFGVDASDPVTFVAVAALLISVMLAASYVPARRATSVDPVVALRYE